MTSIPEQLVLESLHRLGIPYESLRIDPEFADTALFCAKYGFPADQTGNTIIVASKKEPKIYVACLVLSNTKLDVNKKVTKLMGVSKASFAGAAEMEALTGMQVGGVTPFSLPASVPLFVDSRVMERDWIILGGGSRGLKLRIVPQHLEALGAQVIADLAA